MTTPRGLAWLIAVALAPAALALPRQELVEAVATQRQRAADLPTVEAWNDLGNLLVRLGSPEEARTAYQNALALDGTSTLALYNLGLLELELDELDKARAHLERILEIDPGYALAHYRLGDLFRLRDRNPKAVMHYADAFILDPELGRVATNPEILSNPLVTWAQMYAYLHPDPGRSSRRYGNPGRIARLFVGETILPPATSPETVAPEPGAEPPSDAPDLVDGSR